jgi:hypothetical protein
MLLFIAIFCTDVYLIVLCPSLLLPFLSHSDPALYYTTESCRILDLHFVFLPRIALGYDVPFLLLRFGL